MEVIYSRPHENIRLAVAKEVLDIVKEVIKEMLKYVSGLPAYSLLKLLEFVENVEYWRIIIPQEIGAGRGFVDMDLFNRIIFEFKGRESEFGDGYRKIINEYLPAYPHTKYCIITNWSKWEIYKAISQNALMPIYKGDRRRALPILKNIIGEILKDEGYKVPPHPSAITVIFRDLVEYEKELINIYRKLSTDTRIKPLYEAFKVIIRTVYSEADEEFILRLFIKHTILQMVILASLSKVLNKTLNPIEMCSGIKLDIEVALPYLNWWFIAYTKLKEKLNTDDIEFIEKLASEIAIRVNIIDWDVVYLEDVFREFYELLIDRETRRKIGEYYTPLWIVELMIERVKHLIGSFKGKIILDPFCGSGTFLVMSFYEKIKEGEDPSDAIMEVIGFDINPLAVSIARAELILAYRKISRNNGLIPKPLIFHTDTLYAMFKSGIPSFSTQKTSKQDLFSYLESKKAIGLEEIKIIEDKILRLIIPNLSKKIKEIQENSRENLIDLLRIESSLATILRLALYNCENDKNRKECIRKNIESSLKQMLNHGAFGKAAIGEIFKQSLVSRIGIFCNALTELLEKYGNGVWAASIVSMLSPLVIKYVKADIIQTNPPWLQLTKFKSYYAKTLIDKAILLIRESIGSSSGAGRIVMGSDLASMALYGALSMVKEAVAFVMPREASFYAKTSQRSGILLTYSVIRSFRKTIDYVEMIDLDFDAFQHGNYPSLVIIRLKTR